MLPQLLQSWKRAVALIENAPSIAEEQVGLHHETEMKLTSTANTFIQVLHLPAANQKALTKRCVGVSVTFLRFEIRLEESNFPSAFFQSKDRNVRAWDRQRQL